MALHKQGRLAGIAQGHPTSPSNMVCDGDSLAAGDDSNFRSIVTALGVNNYNNQAMSGLTLTTMISRAAATIDPLLITNANNILIMWEIVNEYGSGSSAAQIQTKLQTYCQARRSAGWQVVVTTATPWGSNSGFEAVRTTVNTWIRANWSTFADALADVGSDPIIGNVANAGNTTYFTDTLHLTAAGNNLTQPYFQAAVAALL